MWPAVGVKNPLIIANKVVLPAPFGPISAVIHPDWTLSETLSTASKPPKRLLTPATRSSGSAMGLLRLQGFHGDETLPHLAAQPGNAARGESHDQDEDAAVNDEIEPRHVAGGKLGRFPQRLDHERAEQRAEHRADAAHDGGEQRLDRNPGAIGNAGIEEQEILSVKTAGRRGDRRRYRHGAEFYQRRIHAKRLGGVLVLAQRDQIGAEAAVFDHAHRHERYGDKPENDPVERHAALKLQRFRAQVELNE